MERRTSPKTYKKDKKITIMTREKYTNDMYETSYRDAPLPGGENIWAYYRQASAKEVMAAIQTVDYKLEAIFKIGWRDDLEKTMTIIFRGDKYKISGIDDYEGYKKDLTIYAYRVN